MIGKTSSAGISLMKPIWHIPFHYYNHLIGSTSTHRDNPIFFHHGREGSLLYDKTGSDFTIISVKLINN